MGDVRGQGLEVDVLRMASKARLGSVGDHGPLVPMFVGSSCLLGSMHRGRSDSPFRQRRPSGSR